jgi:hypothetical protein
MIITIIAEPRSGSTSLANWFSHKKNGFTVLLEPITTPGIRWYKNGLPPKSWKYNTPHLVIKEIYRPNMDFSELLEISDKIIILYRENVIEQRESWLMAIKTNNWDKEWIYNEELVKNDGITFFDELKYGFKKEYLNSEYFNISYEELYYENGFQRILNYIDLDCIKNENFPHNKKYKIIQKEKKLL